MILINALSFRLHPVFLKLLLNPMTLSMLSTLPSEGVAQASEHYPLNNNYLVFQANQEGVKNIEKWNRYASNCLSSLEQYPKDNQELIKSLCETLGTYTKAIQYHDHTFEAQVMYQHLYLLMNEEVSGPDESGDILFGTTLEKIFSVGNFRFPQFEPLVHMMDQLQKLEYSYTDVSLSWWDQINMSLMTPFGFFYGSKNPVSQLVLNSWYYMESRYNFHVPTFTERRKALMDEVAKSIKTKIPIFKNDSLSPEKRIAKIITMIDQGLTRLTFKKQVEFLDALKNLRQVDWLILNILSAIDQLNFGEVLKGAHVRLDDQGLLYKTISEHPMFPGKSRVSSHYPLGSLTQGFTSSSDLQRGMIPGTSLMFPELLMGVVVDQNGCRRSWFQLEAHGLSWKAPLESLGHFRDYVAHMRSGKLQVSKWGFSAHSEKKSFESSQLFKASEICYDKSSLEELVLFDSKSEE